jgi:hypothetical protein
MADLTVTATAVAPVKVIEQITGPAAGAINAGTPVYLDANGKFVAGDASAAGTAGVIGVSIQTVTNANETITVVRNGWIDMGAALDALAMNASVYLSDTAGATADAAGTVSKVVGTVVPGWASPNNLDRLLRVDL